MNKQDYSYITNVDFNPWDFQEIYLKALSATTSQRDSFRAIDVQNKAKLFQIMYEPRRQASVNARDFCLGLNSDQKPRSNYEWAAYGFGVVTQVLLQGCRPFLSRGGKIKIRFLDGRVHDFELPRWGAGSIIKSVNDVQFNSIEDTFCVDKVLKNEYGDWHFQFCNESTPRLTLMSKGYRRYREPILWGANLVDV